MSRHWFAGLALLLLAVTEVQAQSYTECERGMCKERVCRRDAYGNEACSIRTYWDRPSAEEEEDLMRALPKANSLVPNSGGGAGRITSVPHRLYSPRQPTERPTTTPSTY